MPVRRSPEQPRSELATADRGAHKIPCFQWLPPSVDDPSQLYFGPASKAFRLRGIPYGDYLNFGTPVPQVSTIIRFIEDQRHAHSDPHQTSSIATVDRRAPSATRSLSCV